MPAQTTRRWRPARVPGTAVLVAVVGGLTSTGLGGLLTVDQARAEDRLMEQRTVAMQAAVTNEARRYVETLTTLAAGAGSLTEITTDSFAALTSPVGTMDLPGATGIALVVPAEGQDMAEVQSAWRARGAVDLELRPYAHDDQHLFSVLQRPVGGSRLAPAGLDLAASPQATAALTRSRERSEVAVSRPYELLADRYLPPGERQQSFVIAAPVVAPDPSGGAGTFRGWLLMGMHGEDFVGETLHTTAEGQVRAALLAEDDDGWTQVAGDPRGLANAAVDVRRTVRITIADQQWLLQAGADRADLPGGGNRLARAVGAGGLLLTAVSTALALVLTTGRRRAERQVEVATRDLRAAQEEAQRQAGLLGAVMDSLGDGVGVVDQDGRYLLSNRASRAILGIGDVDGPDRWQRHFGLYAADGRTPFDPADLPLVRALAGETVVDVEMFVRNEARPDGLWLEVSARPLDPRTGQSGAVAVFHDITARRAAHEAVRRSEEQLRLLLDGARDHAIVMLDPRGRVQSWSANAERIHGQTEAEILGRPYAVFFPADAVAAGEPERALADAVRTGRTETERMLVRKDGTCFWALGVLTPVHDDTGVLQGFVDVTRDITATRRAEARFRDLLEAAPDAILGCDEDGVVVFANSKVDELFGYRREDLLGQSMDILVPDAVRPAHAAHRSAYLRDPVARPMSAMQLSARRKDGSLFPVEISLSTLQSEDGLIVSAAVRDVSERVRAQEELGRLNRALRDLNTELELRADELTLSNAELQELDRLKSTFVATVSHELRTPLSNICGYTELLTESGDGDLGPQQRRMVEVVERNAGRLLDLIEDLLTFARAEAGTLAPVQVPLDLNDLVTQVLRDLGPSARTAGVELEARPSSEPATVPADRSQIERVLANLLSNALKFTGPDGSAVVTTEVLPTVVVVSVADDGPGIPVEEQHKLFQRFYRADDAYRRQIPGTGLGLSIARAVVEAHGGSIALTSTPGAGTVVTFELPR